MLRVIVVAFLMLAAAATCLGDELIRIPLDLGATELYLGESDTRLDFDAERDLTGISGARLHVTGFYMDHRSVCWVDGGIGAGVGLGDGKAGLYQGFVIGENLGCVTEYVLGNTEDGETVFNLELEFDCGGPDTDWSFLADGAGAVHLRGLECDPFPAYPMICICDASAVVESATLIIQSDSEVAPERQSWGTIKAWYR